MDNLPGTQLNLFKTPTTNASPDFLTAYIPPTLLSNLTSLLPTSPFTTLAARTQTYYTIYSYLSPLLQTTLSLYTTIQTLFTPFLAQLRQSPDAASVLLLGILLFVSLKLLNILRRALMFWVVVAARLTTWVGLALAALWLYTRGPVGAAQDLRGVLGYVGEVFWEEYQKAQSGQGVAQAQRGVGAKGVPIGKKPTGGGKGGTWW